MISQNQLFVNTYVDYNHHKLYIFADYNNININEYGGEVEHLGRSELNTFVARN